MLTQIKGLHHVTAMASDAKANNAFFTHTLGLRRVKKTVNFDAPEVYHLYYGDAAGTPGSVMTYFPFPDLGPRREGMGEVSATAFSVPEGSLSWWQARLSASGAGTQPVTEAFGERRLAFRGPDREELVLVEQADERAPWTDGGVSAKEAIRGFHGVTLRLRETGSTEELLRLMGYAVEGREERVTRLVLPGGKGAAVVDLEAAREGLEARQGAGSVHHVAFAVPDRAAQLAVRQALVEAGQDVTPVIDRDYFWAIYFRSPGGVLFEVATNEPGFDRDEDPAHLGEALKLPQRHEHLRAQLEKALVPIE